MTPVEEALADFDLREIEAGIARLRNRQERTVKRLIKKHDKLLGQVRQLESEIAQIEKELSISSTGKRVRKPNARRLNDISLADAIEAVLKRRKNPVHYKELTQIIQEKGLYKTRSKNLLSTVAVTLSRDKRFKKTEPGFYTLA